MIRLSVPGTLPHRDLVLRVVASSCKLARRAELQDADQDEIEDRVVSAVGEAFNNVAIHGYGSTPGEVAIEIDTDDERIVIRMKDWGRTFDPTAPSPEPAPLPESGMGVYIITSFMDQVSYRAGHPPRVPNELVLEKRWRRSADP